MWTPLFSAYIESLAFVARFVPSGVARRRRVRHIANQSYAPDNASRAHRFDVWRPHGSGPWPLLMYVHGGGFTLGSKDSHWWMAAHLAAQGLCVVTINYRLAPQHPHPRALEDVARAWRYLGAHAQALGADPNNVALMGDSAGANLVLALAVAHAATQPPAWLGKKPPLHLRAVVPAAGLLDVAEPERFLRIQPPPSRLIFSRIRNVCTKVLARGATGLEAELAWASPLRIVEAMAAQGDAGAFSLPPMHIGVGANDPIRDDSLRLARALAALGSEHTLLEFPQSGHAFFAWPSHKQTPAFWQETVAFLHDQLSVLPSSLQRQVAPVPTAERTQ